jgi:hypothetical protein
MESSDFLGIFLVWSLLAAIFLCVSSISSYKEDAKNEHSKYVEACYHQANISHSPATDYVTPKYFACVNDGTQPAQCSAEALRELSYSPYASNSDGAKRLLYVFLQHQYDGSAE